jgi:DNA-binding MarR family transcriptional regulator
MPKLNDTQLIILSTAAKRDNGAVRPLSKSIKADTPTIDRALKSLLKQELLKEHASSEGRRSGKGDTNQTLVITDAGRAAIDAGKEPSDEARPPAKARLASRTSAAVVEKPDAGPSGIR